MRLVRKFEQISGLNPIFCVCIEGLCMAELITLTSIEAIHVLGADKYHINVWGSRALILTGL